MSGRRILVTGVGGFVGSHLVRAIGARGDTPIGLGDRAAPLAIRNALETDHVVDVRDAKELKQVLADTRPDVVIHLAGQSSVADSIERPLATLEANAAGTWNLLDAVHRAAPSARVLAVGSADVYGPQPESTRVREDAALRPMSPYALSKLLSDRAAEYYGSRMGLDVVRTRSFPHMGPGQSEQFVIPALARQIAEAEGAGGEGQIQVGNLEVTRDFTHVDSVVEAYLALVERGQRGGVYNVCSGVPVRLSQLAGKLVERARVSVRLSPDPRRMRPSDIPYLVGDPAAIARDTGWIATVDLDRALDQVLEEWRARVAAPRPAAPIDAQGDRA